jgi:hypothetical protein
MRTHVIVLGWIYIVHGCLAFVVTFLCLCIYVVVPAVFASLGGLISGSFAITITIALFVAFLGLIAGPDIFAGWGLVKLKGWARIMALVLGILNLAFFPTGTVVGIYSLFVLFNNETIRLFKESAHYQQQTGEDKWDEGCFSNLFFVFVIVPVVVFLFILITIIAMAKGWLPKDFRPF